MLKKLIFAACLVVCAASSGAWAQEAAAPKPDEPKTWGYDLNDTYVSLYYGDPDGEDLTFSLSCERKSGAVTMIAPYTTDQAPKEKDSSIALSGEAGTEKVSAAVLPNLMTGQPSDLVGSPADPKPILALFEASKEITLDLDGLTSSLPLDAKTIEAVTVFRQSCPSAR